jgi:hypothetical protein
MGGPGIDTDSGAGDVLAVEAPGAAARYAPFMHTADDLQTLLDARALVEDWGEVYWQAGQDGRVVFGAELNGESLNEARERWLGMVAAVEGVEYAAVFNTAALEYLASNEAVGRAEADAERLGRTYDAGIATGEARYRRHLAMGVLLAAARPRIGGGTAEAESAA